VEDRAEVGARESIGAVDRRELAKTGPVKESRWPRTERRQERIAGVLARRQPDLTVVLENVDDPHNVSAVLRSCDAVGVLRVHTVYLEDERPDAFARTTSASAAKWVEVVHHDSVEACYARLRSDGFRILATALEDESVDLFETDLARPVALVFGNEMRGITPGAAQQADGTIFIPMMGMVQSLNISVACAVTLYEALRQRRAAGAYATPKIDSATRAELEADWLQR
jgi:tRNA (guanosine-2'-O-)-methyltransferase